MQRIYREKVEGRCGGENEEENRVKNEEPAGGRLGGGSARLPWEVSPASSSRPRGLQQERLSLRRWSCSCCPLDGPDRAWPGRREQLEEQSVSEATVISIRGMMATWLVGVLDLVLFVLVVGGLFDGGLVSLWRGGHYGGGC